MALTRQDWVEKYANALGVPVPQQQEIADLLDLAGVAAHSSERTAAPITCWLAARAGIAPGEALARGQELARELDESP